MTLKKPRKTTHFTVYCVILLPGAVVAPMSCCSTFARWKRPRHSLAVAGFLLTGRFVDQVELRGALCGEAAARINSLFGTHALYVSFVGQLRNWGVTRKKRPCPKFASRQSIKAHVYFRAYNFHNTFVPRVIHIM